MIEAVAVLLFFIVAGTLWGIRNMAITETINEW